MRPPGSKLQIIVEDKIMPAAEVPLTDLHTTHDPRDYKCPTLTKLILTHNMDNIVCFQIYYRYRRKDLGVILSDLSLVETIYEKFNISSNNKRDL